MTCRHYYTRQLRGLFPFREMPVHLVELERRAPGSVRFIDRRALECGRFISGLLRGRKIGVVSAAEKRDTRGNPKDWRGVPRTLRTFLKTGTYRPHAKR